MLAFLGTACALPPRGAASERARAAPLVTPSIQLDDASHVGIVDVAGGSEWQVASVRLRDRVPQLQSMSGLPDRATFQPFLHAPLFKRPGSHAVVPEIFALRLAQDGVATMYNGSVGGILSALRIPSDAARSRPWSSPVALGATGSTAATGPWVTAAEPRSSALGGGHVATLWTSDRRTFQHRASFENPSSLTAVPVWQSTSTVDVESPPLLVATGGGLLLVWAEEDRGDMAVSVEDLGEGTRVLAHVGGAAGGSVALEGPLDLENAQLVLFAARQGGECRVEVTPVVLSGRAPSLAESFVIDVAAEGDGRCARPRLGSDGRHAVAEWELAGNGASAAICCSRSGCSEPKRQPFAGSLLATGVLGQDRWTMVASQDDGYRVLWSTCQDDSDADEPPREDGARERSTLTPGLEARHVGPRVDPRLEAAFSDGLATSARPRRSPSTTQP